MDLIDRKAAIDALNELMIYRPLDSDRYVISDCLNKIVGLPSADVQPVRHGRWGKVNECSECGCQPWYERDIHFLHYCPNCGARMDGEQNDDPSKI